jgi:hypothetical protein
MQFEVKILKTKMEFNGAEYCGTNLEVENVTVLFVHVCKYIFERDNFES